jgi:hypothetical protein
LKQKKQKFNLTHSTHKTLLSHEKKHSHIIHHDTAKLHHLYKKKISEKEEKPKDFYLQKKNAYIHSVRFFEKHKKRIHKRTASVGLKVHHA